MDHPLDNPAWHALTGPHAGLAEVTGTARRYPRDVSVFSAVDRLDDAAWADLAGQAGPEHVVILTRAALPEPPAGWSTLFRARTHQMVAGNLVEVAPVATRPLGPEHAAEMMALVELTKPGPFVARTVDLGGYQGVFDDDGRLVAMTGRRMQLDGWAEVSAVCTHPDARGRGLAAALTRRVADGIRADGAEAFLHVAEDNHTARRVYERLGFTTRRMVEFAAYRTPAA